MAEPQFQHIQSATEQGVLVLTLLDRQLRSDELADALRQEFIVAANQARLQRVVIDFKDVEYLSSAGIRPLLSLRRHLQVGRLVLCNLKPLIAEVFHATRLISTSGSSTVPFEAAPDVLTAIARLNDVGSGI